MIFTYTYDSKNQVTGIQHKEGTETVAAYAYTYDVSGRVLTESVSYDSETEKVTAYEYDAEGRLIKVIYPESSGIGTITYTYDLFGNVLEIKKDNALVREYVYDAFYRVVRIKDYDTPGSSSYTLKTYTYDNFGRTVSAVYTEDGDSTKVVESFVYSYDKNDNILSETRISNLPAEDKVINETRDYKDPKNLVNWIALGVDTACALVPFVTGGGSVVRGIAKSDDVIDAAKALRKKAPKKSDLRNATGSDVIKFTSGKVYVGKGGYKRAITSAENYSRKKGQK